jgi:KUP system potassium uptake protein
VLATLATVVASQALISGAFSLTSQAIGLGLFPRFDVLHTHLDHAGQIYIPVVNWGLYLGCVALVIAFGSSSALAAAYGLAVAGVMLITSSPCSNRAALLALERRANGAGVGPLTAINGAFLVASSLKFMEGGFVPLSVGVAAFLVMATWRWGRKATFAAYAARSTMTMAELVALHRGTSFLERNALIMAPVPAAPSDRPRAGAGGLLWERYGVLPRNLILVEVTHPKVPYIHDNRYHVTVFDRDQDRGSVIGVELRFGFMEEPNVERYLEAWRGTGDRPAAASRPVDRPCLAREPAARATNEPAQTLALPPVPVPAPGLRPAYYAYHLGDEVQLSAEIMPVRVR